MAKAPVNPRIEAMLELERRGTLPPAFAEQLAVARQQGVVKSPPPIIKTDATAAAQLRAADLLEDQLNDVEAQYNAKLKGTPLERGFGLMEYLPTDANREFDAAAGGLTAPAKALSRSPGEGTFTDADLAQLQSQLPNSSERDLVNEQRIKNLRRLIETNRRPLVAPRPALGSGPASGALGSKKPASADVVIEFDANGKPVRR